MSLPAPVISPAPAAEPRVHHPAPAQIDLSCRNPVLFFFTAAISWLALGTLLAAIASIKLHGPGFLAHWAAFSYGRLQPAQSNIFLYGFASQAAMGTALWLICRLGRTTLLFPGAALAGGLFWNIGVAFGILGILAGNSSGYPGFEMPRGVSLVLFCSYLIFGVSALVTFHSRTERKLYVSMWYLLAAILSFPWIYATAVGFLHYGNLRGGPLAIVSVWYANNFIALWLAPVALAVIYYFVPKLSGRSLYSGGLAAFAFWVYFVFANSGGFQAMAGLPRWIINLSVVTTVIMSIPVLAMAINWHFTWSGGKAKSGVVPRFIWFGAISFILSGALTLFTAFRETNASLAYTHYLTGLSQLGLYGFFGLTLLGAIYYIVPKLTGTDWPKPAWVTAHSGLTIAGIAISVLALLGGGVLQGQNLLNPRMPFMDVVRATLPFLGISTLGLLLVAVGQILLLLHLLFSFARSCAACCGSLNSTVKTAGVTR